MCGESEVQQPDEANPAPPPVSADCPDDPVANSTQTTFVESEVPQPDEANPASTTVFSNEVLINEAAIPAGDNLQDQQTEPPVIEFPCFFDTPHVMKWYINPDPKFLPNLSVKKILSNRPLNHPVPSDALSKNLALGFVISTYFCSRNVLRIMMGS